MSKIAQLALIGIKIDANTWQIVSCWKIVLVKMTSLARK